MASRQRTGLFRVLVGPETGHGVDTRCGQSSRCDPREPSKFPIAFRSARILLPGESLSPRRALTLPAAGRYNARGNPEERGHLPVIDVNDLRKGVTFELDRNLYKVLEYSHHKPGRGTRPSAPGCATCAQALCWKRPSNQATGSRMFGWTITRLSTCIPTETSVTSWTPRPSSSPR